MPIFAAAYCRKVKL